MASYKPNPIAELIIPLKFLNPKDSSVFVYGLDSTTIGISDKYDENWDKQAIIKTCVTYTYSENAIVIRLPKEFIEQYKATRIEILGLAGPNKIILLAHIY